MICELCGGSYTQTYNNRQSVPSVLPIEAEGVHLLAMRVYGSICANCIIKHHPETIPPQWTEGRFWEVTPEAPQVPRVWVLEPLGYDQYGIVGVFATPDAAKAYIPSLKWSDRPDKDGEWLSVHGPLYGGYRVYAEEIRQ